MAVILPAYNEEATIGLTIEDVHHNIPSALVVVVDNNCTDRTRELALDLRAMVTRCSKQGKGHAVQTALQRVVADYYVMIDADYTYPARHIPDIVRLLRHKADVVIGYRQWQSKRATSAVNRAGNWGLSMMARTLYRFPVHDVCSGMWGFRRRVAEKLKLESAGFTLEAELLVKCLRMGARIEQIPIEYRARFYDSKSKLRVSTGLGIGKYLLTHRNRHYGQSLLPSASPNV